LLVRLSPLSLNVAAGATVVEDLVVADSTAVGAVDFTVAAEAGSTAVAASIPVAVSAEGLPHLLQVTALDATAAVRQYGLVADRLRRLGAVSLARVARVEVTRAGFSVEEIPSHAPRRFLTAVGIRLAARPATADLRGQNQEGRPPRPARASAALAGIALLALPVSLEASLAKATKSGRTER
jgi:hypothetical protein